MQCSRCSLPLHPTNIPDHCPRCGTTVIHTDTPADNAGFQQFLQEIRTPYHSAKTTYSAEEKSTVLTIEQADTLEQQPAPAKNIWQPMPRTILPHPAPSSMGSALPLNSPASTAFRNIRSAFVCLTASGMLMILVYILTISIGQAAATITKTSHAQTITNTIPAIATTVPLQIATPATSPVESNYIYNAQMANAINLKTAAIETSATTFAPNEHVYVTFDIQTNGKSGDVCLQWYLNSTNVSNFDFAVTPASRVAYSYITYRAAGSAYVDIYWANSLGCSDSTKVIAQHIEFTVQ